MSESPMDPEIERASSDFVESLRMQRDLESPREALLLGVVSTAAVFVEALATWLVGYERFEDNWQRGLTRVQAFHTLFVLRDATELCERLSGADVAQRLATFGWGNSTEIPETIRRGIFDITEGIEQVVVESEGRHKGSPRYKYVMTGNGVCLTEQGLSEVNELRAAYYREMERIPESGRVSELCAALRDLRDVGSRIAKSRTV